MLTDSPAWKALAEHKKSIEAVHLRELFQKDPKRFDTFSVEAGDVFLDYSKHRVTDETMKLLFRSRGSEGRRVARQDVPGERSTAPKTARCSTSRSATDRTGRSSSMART